MKADLEVKFAIPPEDVAAFAEEVLGSKAKVEVEATVQSGVVLDDGSVTLTLRVDSTFLRDIRLGHRSLATWTHLRALARKRQGSS